jgi:two-component system response regulator YesN
MDGVIPVRLKAMLVDDEMPILHNLRAVVPWEELDIEIVAMARNGVEALEAVQAHQPDLILCDIRMPIMDGLTLLGEIRKINKDMEVLMLTGYQEFEYARIAIQHGVRDYILKPIDYELLEQTVCKVADSIRVSRTEKISKEKKWVQVAHLAYERLLYDTLMGFSTDGAGRLLANEGEAAAEFVYSVLLADFDDYSQKSVVWSEKERRLWNFAIGNVLREALLVFALKYSVLQIREGEWCIVIEHRKADYSGKETSIAAWVQALQSAIVDNVKLGVSIGIYPEPVDITELPHTYKKMQRMLLQHAGGSHVVSVTEEALEASEANRFLWSFMEEITAGLKQMDRNKIDRVLTQLQQYFLAESEQMLGRTEKFLHFLTIHLLRDMREMELVTPEEEGLVWKSLQISTGVKNGMEAIMRLVDHAMETALTKKSGDLLMLSAKEYIQRNLALDIGTQEVADHLGISISYFALLFKTYFGETFVEYVTKQRMELAKAMLRSTDKSITKIGAQVGYAERRYFTKVFQKYEGRTPSEYREVAPK